MGDGKDLKPVAKVNPIPENDARNEEILLKYVGTLFRIDDDGTIWRIAETRQGKAVPCEPRRAEYDRKNYCRIRTWVNGIRVRASAHRLVYITFKGPIAPNAIINHIDGNRSNNHPDNLEAISQSANVRHGRRWRK